MKSKRTSGTLKKGNLFLIQIEMKNCGKTAGECDKNTNDYQNIFQS